MSVTQKLLAAIAVLISIAVPGNVIAARSRSHVVASEAGGARYRFTAAAAHRNGAQTLGAGLIKGTFRFAPGTADVSRAAFLRAVADARPRARRLIDLVDGVVTVTIGQTGHNAIGLTSFGGREPGYAVIVDLGPVSQRYGQRGIDRVVLHELGHVVDHALVPAALDAQLDSGIPRGYGCDQGLSGSCATRDERFAESFAKWAMNDIGMDLDIGYKVMPPAGPLDVWGAPLDRLGA